MSTGITYKNLFGIYYNLYRGEAIPPATTDDEWPISIRNYNDGLYRLMAADDTKWNWLFKNLSDSTQVSPVLVKTLSASVTTYAAPQDMYEPGGQYTITDTSGNSNIYSVIQPYEAQAMDDNAYYGFFTGNRMAGFTFNINPIPSTSDAGSTIDYTYYRKPTLLIASTDDGTVEDGTSIVEGFDPSYMYNHMLAQRLKVDENWSSYQVAMRDAEEALKNMKLKNNSGAFFGQWLLKDTSGSGWGR